MRRTVEWRSLKADLAWWAAERPEVSLLSWPARVTVQALLACGMGGETAWGI